MALSESKIMHMLGVARKCYSLAKQEGYDEGIARDLFLIGFLHDIGYEFCEESKFHPEMSYEMIENLTGYKCEAIRLHGKPYADLEDFESRILNIADLTVDKEGKDVSAKERLLDIKLRYGKDSNQYKNALDLAKRLNLINND